MNQRLKGDTLTVTQAQRRRYTLLLTTVGELQRQLADTDRGRNYKKELLKSGRNIAYAMAAIELAAKSASYIGGNWWKKISTPVFALTTIYLGGSWVSYQIGGDEGTAQFNRFLNLTATQPSSAIEVTIGSVIAVTTNPENVQKVQKVVKDVESGYQELAKRYEPLTDAFGLS